MSKENELLETFTKFMLEHDIECEEDLYQNEDIDRDAFELIEDLFNVVKSNNVGKDDKQTNADRIRNMSDEELAGFIVGLNLHCLAGLGKCDCKANKTCDNCNAEVKNWLQSATE